MAPQLALYQLSTESSSDRGLVRRNNEDCTKSLKEERFFVLADGMGGHQAGEVASQKTVELLCERFRQKGNWNHFSIEEAKQHLKAIIQEVNQAVYHLSRESIHLKGMGTTLCCCYLHPAGLIYGHVGDSRIYLFRRGELKQLTQDHSLLRELIELGQLSEQQAEEFLYKNIITKAIGTEPFVDAAIQQISVEVGDLVMMCSDGLSDLVSIKEIREIIGGHREEGLAGLLVEKAKQRGGYDNITVVVIKIESKQLLDTAY